MHRISMHRLQELVRLHRLGESVREVARKIGMSPNTERLYRKALEAAKLLEGDAQELPELSELEAAVAKYRQLKQHIPVSSVEPWRGIIEKLLEEGAGPTAIYDRLRLEFDNFEGSLSAIKRFVAGIQKNDGPRPEQVAIPVTCEPGATAQVDFGSVGKLWDPEAEVFKQAFVFVMVLAYSRHHFAKLVFNQKVETWLELHVEAFSFFGGVPKVVVPDNLKAAVIRGAFDVRNEPVLNRSYRDCARHFGFKVDPTPPYSPQKKGKVESGVKYVKNNYMKAVGDERNILVLNDGLSRWTLEIAGTRAHATTTHPPVELFQSCEQEKLLALPKQKWEHVAWREPMVHRDSCVLVEKARYSVPWRLIGKKLLVRVTTHSVEVYWENTRVATHSRLSAGEQSVRLEHLPEGRGEYGQRDQNHWVERAAKIGQDTHKYVEELFESDDVLAQLTKVQSIVRYLESFPSERANAACRRASFYGSYSYATIKRILSKSLDFEPLPKLQFAKAESNNSPKYARNINEYLNHHPEDHDASH